MKSSLCGPDLVPRGLVVSTLLLALSFSAAVCARAQTLPALKSGPPPQAPPPAPPIQYRTNIVVGPAPRPRVETPYSIGQPTDEEQLYLEYLNRMRANPTAEGRILANTTNPGVLASYSYFNVDLTLMQSEFSTNPPVPPLAMNADLMAAARLHSGDMFTNIYQGHTGSDGTNPGQRITAQGYNWSEYGENVYAYASSVFYGHAGFAVDWGTGTGGMQTPPGHRENMLNGQFREVGMGVVDGSNGSVGPQLVTQDLGTQPANAPFITGVVYYDFNSNAFYDLGEGIGGVTVSTPGSAYYAVTADSGGFAIPVTSNGNYTVTFTASGLSNQVVVAVAGLKNYKVDYAPAYSPPVITGPNPAAVNQGNNYNFSPVGAATGYQWRQTQIAPYTYVEGAENGLGNVTVTISSNSYSVIDTDYANSGTHSFHLAQPDVSAQIIELNPVIQLTASSVLSFAKMLTYSGSGQIAEAQISTDGGATWQNVWTQTGSEGPGETSFTTIHVPLAAYAGQTVQVRFAYVFSGGEYYNETSPGVGLYLDDIAISNANQTFSPIVGNIPSGTSFVFTPTSMATYLLQVRAQINSRTLSWGPADTVTVGTAPPSLLIVSPPTISGAQIQIDFTVANYVTGMTFQLWKATAVTGPWTQDASASLSTLVANSKFQLTTSTGAAASTFYRVKGSY
jgi:hypothetical protein